MLEERFLDDRHGLPLAVTTHAANHHEVTLVLLAFDFYIKGTCLHAKTHDGRRLRRYQRRRIVERIFAWMRWQQQPLGRWEYYLVNFLGIVHLAALCILLILF